MRYAWVLSNMDVHIMFRMNSDQFHFILYNYGVYKICQDMLGYVKMPFLLLRQLHYSKQFANCVWVVLSELPVR